jgi:hypothetical protein
MASWEYEYKQWSISDDITKQINIPALAPILIIVHYIDIAFLHPVVQLHTAVGALLTVMRRFKCF